MQCPVIVRYEQVVSVIDVDPAGSRSHYIEFESPSILQRGRLNCHTQFFGALGGGLRENRRRRHEHGENREDVLSGPSHTRQYGILLSAFPVSGTVWPRCGQIVIEHSAPPGRR